MTKKIFVLFVILMILASPSSIAVADKPSDFDTQGNVLNSVSDNGFDQWGYNRTARIFSGTGLSWCMEQGSTEAWCESYLGAYANDKLVMKWNAEWDRGNEEGWANGPYDAWENNQWNGMEPGGSGEIWHYKIVWVGPCTDGADCIWDQFAVIMSQGTAGGEHIWDVLAQPAGYGSYP